MCRRFHANSSTVARTTHPIGRPVTRVDRSVTDFTVCCSKTTERGDGAHRALPGGGAYRCGLVIDVGKCIPPPPPILHPELERLVGETIGLELVAFADIY